MIACVHRRQLRAHQPPAAGTSAGRTSATCTSCCSPPGSPITEVNAVRKHVSAFKGGRLRRGSLPARLVNLTVSDVAGDSLDAITDPTVADSTRPSDAIAILHGHGLWDGHPAFDPRPPARARSPSRRRSTGPRSRPCCWSPGERLRGDVARGDRPGRNPVVISTELEGEARQVGKLLANLARHSSRHACAVRRRHGAGRLRRREHGRVRRRRRGLRRAAARTRRRRWRRRCALADGVPAAAVFLDTDGSDGGTAHAGAIVDGHTVARAAAAGLDLRAALLEHRSSVALAALERRARHRPHRHQRQRPVRDRRGGRVMSEAPMIVVERLVKEFGDVRAVDDVTLEIRGRRVLLDARPERLRQDDDPASDRRASRRPTPVASCSTARTSPSSPRSSATSTWSSRTTRCSRT